MTESVNRHENYESIVKTMNSKSAVAEIQRQESRKGFLSAGHITSRRYSLDCSWTWNLICREAAHSTRVAQCKAKKETREREARFQMNLNCAGRQKIRDKKYKISRPEFLEPDQIGTEVQSRDYRELSSDLAIPYIVSTLRCREAVFTHQSPPVTALTGLRRCPCHKCEKNRIV